MSVLDNRIPGKVSKILAKYGANAIFETHTIDRYDTSTGRVEQSEAQTYTAKISPPEPFDKDLVDGDNVLIEDRYSIVAALDLPIIPQPLDLVTVNGTKYRVLSVSPIESGDKVAAYQLHLRK